jgi:hypothetical protein
MNWRSIVFAFGFRIDPESKLNPDKPAAKGE